MKKKLMLKRCIIAMLLVVMLIPIVPMVTQAATFYVDGNINVHYNILDGYNGPERTFMYSFKLDDGKNRLAYCVNPSLAGSGTGYNNLTVDPVYINSTYVEEKFFL